MAGAWFTVGLLVLAAFLAVCLSVPVVEVTMQNEELGAGLTPDPVTAPTHGFETTPVPDTTPVVAPQQDLETTSDPGATPAQESEMTPLVGDTPDVATVHKMGTSSFLGMTPGNTPTWSFIPSQDNLEDTASWQDTSGENEDSMNAQRVANIFIAYPPQVPYGGVVKVTYGTHKTTYMHVEKLMRM